MKLPWKSSAKRKKQTQRKLLKSYLLHVQPKPSLFTEAVKKRARKNNGFTLVEMLIVVTIISILATMAQPAIYKRIEYARAQTVEGNVKTLNLAVEDYMRHYSEHLKTFESIADFEAWTDVESLISGGFEACEVKGYTFDKYGLNDCFFSIVIFRGVETSALYTKD